MVQGSNSTLTEYEYILVFNYCISELNRGKLFWNLLTSYISCWRFPHVEGNSIRHTCQMRFVMNDTKWNDFSENNWGEYVRFTASFKKSCWGHFVIVFDFRQGVGLQDSWFKIKARIARSSSDLVMRLLPRVVWIWGMTPSLHNTWFLRVHQFRHYETRAQGWSQKHI